MLFKAALLGATGATLMMATSSAGAATFPSPLSVFNFKGTCIDCNGTGTGELTLLNYAYGSAIDASNFVSFHYDGTNLQTTFTISSPYLLTGSISGPGETMDDLFVFDDSNGFFSDRDGFWSVGLVVADFGYNGTYTSADSSAAPSVPEPATWAMMIVGIGAIGFAMRRRNVTTRIKFA